MTTNLILNPSFTKGSTNWTLTNLTASNTNTHFKFNNTALELTFGNATSADITSDKVTILGETVYTASIYVRLPNDQLDTFVGFRFRTYDSSNTLVDTFNADVQKLSSSQGWYRFVITGTSSSNAVKASITPYIYNNYLGRKLIVDGGQLVTGYSAVAFDYIETVDQALENKVINKALTPVPFPHLTGAQLKADIKLGEFVFNSIDANNVAYVITEIEGLYGQPGVDVPEVSRGFYDDGNYDVSGRYSSRDITLSGSILVQNASAVPSAREKLVRATDLVRRGAWLKLYAEDGSVDAIFVRLSDAVQVDVVNARGRMDFSIGLRASDPLRYGWNNAREDGYYVANVSALNYEGTVVGEVTVDNTGNYRAPAIFDIRGPIVGSQATIFNYANSELIRIIEPVRGERSYAIAQKSMYEYVATLKFSTPHNLVPGDSITVSLPTSYTVTGINRGSSSSFGTVTTSSAPFGVSDGDTVYLTVNGDTDFTGYFQVSNVNTTSNTFTVPQTNATAVSNSSLTSSSLVDINNERFNGVQIIGAIPDARSVAYSVSFRETYPLRNVSGANLTFYRCVAYKDADRLEIDTKDREIALNGDATLQRSRMDALSDWIRLEPGNNKIYFDDSLQSPYYTWKRTVGSGSATLWLTTPHFYSVGDNINVVNVGSNYDTSGRKRISNYYRTGNVVTAISNGYGFSTGDNVVITGISSEVDGKYPITNVNVNAFTFVTNESGTIYNSEVNAIAKSVLTVINYSKTGGNATITTSTAHGLVANDPIYVSGVQEEFDGQWYVSSVTTTPTNTITYSTSIKFTQDYPSTVTTASGATVYRRFPVTSTTDYSITYYVGGSASEAETEFGLTSSVDSANYRAVDKVKRANNIATITTRTKHGYEVGAPLVIQGPSALHPTFQVSTGDSKKVASFTVAGNLATITTSTSHGFNDNDLAYLYGIRTDSYLDINGEYKVDNLTATTFSVTLGSNVNLSYSVLAYEVSNNVARLSLNKSPEFGTTYTNINNGYDLPTRVTVASVATALNGTHDVASIDTVSNIVTYNLTTSNVDYTVLGSAGTMNVNVDTTPERGRVLRRVECVYFTINNQTTGVEASVATNGPLMNAAVAGNTVWVKTNTAHQFTTGSSVEISGISSLFNGIQEITSVDSNMFRFTIDPSVLVEYIAPTITRAASTSLATLTFVSAHGYQVGDEIWIYSPHVANVASGSYIVQTTPTTTTFTITTTATATIATAQRTGYKVLPRLQDATATIVYPVLSDPAPTDYTLSYRSVSTNLGETTLSADESAGEVVSSSDGSMKVYYRPASIG